MGHCHITMDSLQLSRFCFSYGNIAMHSAKHPQGRLVGRPCKVADNQIAAATLQLRISDFSQNNITWRPTDNHRRIFWNR